MLWIKALHIIFVVCWFSGIFYLPRLFVNSAMAETEETKQQLNVMQHKLYRFMSLLAALAIFFGLVLYALNWEYYVSQLWMWLKLLLIVLLLAFHLACGRFVRAFEAGTVNKSHRYFRIFNELPVVLLFTIVILVVVRPF
ncbi:MAG: CopD family protein [Pseudomonadales bacterium]